MTKLLPMKPAHCAARNYSAPNALRVVASTTAPTILDRDSLPALFLRKAIRRVGRFLQWSIIEKRTDAATNRACFSAPTQVCIRKE
jgi:hypothetical protein